LARDRNDAAFPARTADHRDRNYDREDHVTSMRAICAAFAGAAAIAISTAAMAQEWPTRSVIVVSPFAAGTTYDLVAHLVLDQVARQLGQPFVVENRPGGDGSVGVVSVVKAKPDGYTLLLSTSAMSTAVILHKSLPYDALHDLAPVAMFGGEPSMLLAAPGKNFSTVDDLVAAAKANPGKLKFASVGIGSASHLAGLRFSQVAELNVQHIADPGSNEALNDLMAGRVDFYFVPITPALPLAAQGKVVPLAVSTVARWPLLPDLPTLPEMGYTISTFLIWCGLSAPAKTPHEIVDKLNYAIGSALDLPAVQLRLQREGFKPAQMDPEQYGKFLADDMAAMIELGKSAHIEPSD
jgi:tripartite-type tricarboxylate transporter receptor subunit TctC